MVLFTFALFYLVVFLLGVNVVVLGLGGVFLPLVVFRTFFWMWASISTRVISLVPETIFREGFQMTNTEI